MLTQQFMRGVKDEKVTQRLAPMRPREMTFRELQVELRQLTREARMAAVLKTGAKNQLQRTMHATAHGQAWRAGHVLTPCANRASDVR